MVFVIFLFSGGDSEELTDSRSSRHHQHAQEMDTTLPPAPPAAASAAAGGGGARDSASGGDSTHDPTIPHHPSSVNHKSNIVNIGLTPVGPGPWDPKARARLRYLDNTPI